LDLSLAMCDPSVNMNMVPSDAAFTTQSPLFYT
jgi:hypothetical protein